MFDIDGKVYPSLADHGARAIVPALKLVKITPNDASDLPDGACRGIWAAADGTANLTFVGGHTEDGVPLFAGLNQIGVARVRTGGSAADLWAIY